MIVLTAVFLSAQSGFQGTITITVVDQTGAVVPGADLSLQDLSTNEVRKAATQSSGAYSFVGLNIGTYKLTASRAGYASVVYDSVTVHASRVTDLNVTLKVHAASSEIPLTASLFLAAGISPLRVRRLNRQDCASERRVDASVPHESAHDVSDPSHVSTGAVIASPPQPLLGAIAVIDRVVSPAAAHRVQRDTVTTFPS